MIVQHIYLERYDWDIIAFFTDDHDSDEEILEFMEIMGCSEKEIASIAEIMGPSKRNCGFTYSDYDECSTVIYIGPTTSVDEFQNTFDVGLQNCFFESQESNKLMHYHIHHS